MTEFSCNHSPSCNFQLVIIKWQWLGCIVLGSMEIALSNTLKLTALLHFLIFTDISCFIFTVFDLKFLFPFVSFRKPFCLCLAYCVVSGRQLSDWTLHSAGDHLYWQATDSEQHRRNFSSVSMKRFPLKYYFMKKIAVYFFLNWVRSAWDFCDECRSLCRLFQWNSDRGSCQAIRGSWLLIWPQQLRCHLGQVIHP